MGCNHSSERDKKELKEDINEHQLSVAVIEAKELRSMKSTSQCNKS